MPSRAFSIRACLPSDAAVLGELGARLFRQAYGTTHPEPDLTPYLARTFAAERLAQDLAQGLRAWFAVDADHTPMGYACLRRSVPPFPDNLPGTKPAEVLRFYVEETWHGRGVGQALMDACEAGARAWGADCLWVSVWQEAKGPVAFYRRTGLVISGTGIFQFGARQDNDYIMSRALNR